MRIRCVPFSELQQGLLESLPQLLEGSDLLLSSLVLFKGTSGMIIKDQHRQDFTHNVVGLFLTQMICRSELDMTSLHMGIADLVKLSQPRFPTQTIHCFLSQQSRKQPSALGTSTFQAAGYTQQPELIDTVFLLSRSPAT